MSQCVTEGGRWGNFTVLAEFVTRNQLVSQLYICCPCWCKKEFVEVRFSGTRPRIEERLLPQIDVRSDLLVGGRACTNLRTVNSLGATVTDG